MILAFGGTTEGRKTITALEEAGKTYYYSTKTGEQEVTLRHGIRVDGAMDAESMAAFCLSHHIRLLIDAAHPFARQLHATVAKTASDLHLPAIRFERIYPPRDKDILWCDDYDEIPADMHTLLATTGVQTIARLRHLEQQGVKVYYRILPRERSRSLARQEGVPDHQLCFYHEDEDEQAILERLRPDALLLKESGETGGFAAKVTAARALGIRIIAIRRPATPAIFHCVDGEHGLRRMVEKLLPEFYDLHSGLTTGTCATAAAIAATRRLRTGETPPWVEVRLPNGEHIPVTVGYGEDYAFVVKESGDDPDVTNGLEIRVTATMSDHFEIKGGEGVGTITLPGFDYPPGSPAINKVPRQMLRDNITGHVALTISVPEGASIATRTFNPRLGIVGGISIVGVSGIVKPFSESAFLDSIRKCLEVAKASGSGRVVINSGAKSERFVKALYPTLPRQAFVEYGNYIGETLKMADTLGIPHLTLGVMMGKAVKLASGQLDTHSRHGVMDKKWIAEMLKEADCDIDVSQLTLARELWNLVPQEKTEQFCRIVIGHCAHHCEPLFPHGQLTILLIDEEGGIHSATSSR